MICTQKPQTGSLKIENTLDDLSLPQHFIPDSRIPKGKFSDTTITPTQEEELHVILLIPLAQPRLFLTALVMDGCAEIDAKDALDGERPGGCVAKVPQLPETPPVGCREWTCLTGTAVTTVAPGV